MIKHTREEKIEAFGRLLDIQEELREKCPWDREQTFKSLRPNTIEEVYELSDAISKDDKKNICKELGDVIEHVLFYSIMGEEENEFDIADVCSREADKLIFRHPHIYGEIKADNTEDVMKTWEQIKQKEKDGNKTVLAGVPDSLPSIIKAYRIQDKARNVGFDWKDKSDVWVKVREELSELEEELKKGDDTRKEEEFGDFLFSLINAARLYKINPDNALEGTSQRFIQRFNYIENQAKSKGKELKELTLEEMDTLWDKAKQIEKQNNKS